MVISNKAIINRATHAHIIYFLRSFNCVRLRLPLTTPLNYIIFFCSTQIVCNYNSSANKQKT